jgi:hypothetical protein
MIAGLNRRSLIMLAALSGIIGSPARSQVPIKPYVLDFETLKGIAGGLQSIANEVANKFMGRPESDWVSQVAEDATALADLVTKVGRTSSFYGAMLSYDTLLFQKAKEESDWWRALEYVRTAYDDISQKLETLEAVIFQTTDQIADIPVEVSTTQKGKPVNGLYVHFYMRGLPDAESPFLIFSQVTTPTQERVPPGKYVVRVLDSNEKLRQARNADVGGKGELVKIEIPIR